MLNLNVKWCSVFIVINHIVFNMDASLGPDLANVRIDQTFSIMVVKIMRDQSGMTLESNACHFQ